MESGTSEERSPSVEILPEHRKYPVSSLFIACTQVCERFSFYGIQSIFQNYVVNYFNFSPSQGTATVHFLNVVSYISAVPGSILSDNYIGRFWTILICFLTLLASQAFLLIASFQIQGFPSMVITVIAVVVMGLSVGGVKSSIAPFGADQFTLPQQKDMASEYFSIFYFAINVGAIFSLIFTPMLKRVSCGLVECYPLAFGIPTLFTLFGGFLYILPSLWYTKKPPSMSILYRTFRCALSAGWNRLTGPQRSDAHHWVDYADHSEYEKDLRDDTKLLARVMWIYLPQPLFWALYDQQSSTWTVQANHMNPSSFLGELVPEQMTTLNAVFVLIFLPIFSIVVYPICNRIGILTRLLTRMVVGGFLVASAFFIAGFLQLHMEAQYVTELSSGTGGVFLVNTRNDVPSVQGNCFDQSVEVKGAKEIIVNFSGEKECSLGTRVIRMKEKEWTTIWFHGTDGVYQAKSETNREKAEPAYKPKFRFLHNGVSSSHKELKISAPGVETKTLKLETDPGETDYQEEFPNNMELKFTIGDNQILWTGAAGGVYDLLLEVDDATGTLIMTDIEVTPPNKVNILWQIPQYLVITWGEIMFSPTILEFSYLEAPERMKTVLNSARLFCVGLGNIVPMFTALKSLLPKASTSLFTYGTLMVLDTLLLLALACCYTEVENIRRQERQQGDSRGGMSTIPELGDAAIIENPPSPAPEPVIGLENQITEDFGQVPEYLMANPDTRIPEDFLDNPDNRLPDNLLENPDTMISDVVAPIKPKNFQETSI